MCGDQSIATVALMDVMLGQDLAAGFLQQRQTSLMGQWVAADVMNMG